MAEEIKLLQSAMDGNTDAFEQIVKKYQSLVCAITFSGTGRVDISEELAQETFLSAWKNLRQLNKLSGFSSWLCTIARNILNNYYRKKKTVPLDPADLAGISDPAPTPSDNLITQEEHIMLEQALMQIPAEYREPLVMYYRQEKSTREVAVGLGLNESTVRTRLHRARQMLREEIAARLERTLEKTAPGKTFTKAVMVAVGGAAIGMSASANAASAAANAAGTGASTGIAAVMTTVTAKIITVAAVAALAIGAVFAYKHLPQPDQSSVQSDEIAIIPTEQEPIVAPESTETALTEAQEVVAEPIETPENKISGPQNETDVQNILEAEALNESQVSIVNEDKSQTGVRGKILVKGSEQPIQGAKFFTDRKGKKVLAESDSQGSFKILDLKPRRSRIYVIAPNYTSRQFTVDIIENQVHEDFKVELTPCYKVTGTVYDPNDNPIEGASVATFQFTNVPVVTDQEGKFTIDGLDPSWKSYSLHVTHPNYPSVSVNLEAAEAGQTVTKDLMLKPGVTVFGKVTDSQGQPIGKVKVGNTTSRAMWNCIESKTGSNGMYELKNIPVGELVLWAVGKKLAPFVERYSIEGLQARQRIDIELESPVDLHGKLIDQMNNPVSGVYVSIREFKGVSNLSNVRVTSDAEGKFLLKNSPPEGKVILSVFSKSVPNFHPELEVGAEEEYLIQIDRAGRIYGKVIEDKTNESVRSFKVKLESTKKGENRGYGYSASWSREGHNFSSPEGFFDTGRENIAIGAEYALTVYADGFNPLTIDPIAVQPISEYPDRTEFRLQPEIALTGHVLDCNDIPVAGARIRFIDESADDRHWDDSDTAVTDSKGVFQLAGIGEQKRAVYVTAKGHAPYMASIQELPRNTKDEIEVKLTLGAILSGRIIDYDGKPIVDASVSAHMFESLGARLKRLATTDTEGYYEITGLPEGSITVNVSSSGVDSNRMIGHKEIKLMPGESAELNFGDEKGYMVSGIVRKGQELLKDVRIAVSSQDYQNNRMSLYGYTDQNGRFKIEGFEEETYIFFIEYRLKSTTSSTRWDPSIVLNDRRTITIQGDMELDIDLGDGSIGGIIPSQFMSNEKLKIYIRRWTPENTHSGWEYAGNGEVQIDRKFAFSNLRAGKYYVSLNSNNEMLAISDSFELGESEHLIDVVFNTGSAVLKISVIDAETKLPIPHPSFFIKNDLQAYFSSQRYKKEGAHGMLADENGRVAYPNLPKGRYIVNCEAPEYLIAESNWIELEDNQEEAVTVVLERAAIVRFEVSDELRKNYGHETLYVVCNVRNLDIGEKVNSSSMYGLSDEHIVWLCSEKLPKDHQSVIKIPEGSYAIEYRLYSDKQGILSYRMKSPMSEKTVETHLVKTQEFIIDISQ